MFKSIKPIAISSACLGAAIFFCGCEINEGDVAAARDKVVEEQNETQQAREDAKREINEKEIELDHARYTVKRPNYDEQSGVGEMEIELEETRQQMAKKIRKEERETDVQGLRKNHSTSLRSYTLRSSSIQLGSRIRFTMYTQEII